MSNTLKIVGVVVIAIACIAFFFNTEDKPLGSATSGLPASVSTSSAMVVGASPIIAFPVENSCTSRVISVASVPIMIAFGETLSLSSTTVSGIFGNVQGASTTVAYDSGLYGCGLWSVISATGGAADFTITEFK